MLKLKKISLRGISLILCIMLSVPAPAAFAVDGRGVAEDLDNYFVPAFPLIYGEIIGSLPEAGIVGVKHTLSGLEIFDYVFKIIKIGDSLNSGTADKETALDAAMLATNLAIKFAAKEGGKKLVIGTVSVATLPITALLTSIEIARASSRAVAASQTATNLERLYYSIETDPAIKNSNRKLGSGDPIKTDIKAVERLFRKCLMDPGWSELFKSYVTTELGQPWPEPTLWESITVNSDFLQEAAILKEKKRLQGHIARLLIELNKVGKKREAVTVVRKQIMALKAMVGKANPGELKRALKLYQLTLAKLPEIQKHADALPGLVEKYRSMSEKLKASELEHLRTVTFPELMKETVTCMGYVKYLPTTGKHADTRESLLNTLKQGYLDLYEIKHSVKVDVINDLLKEEIGKMINDIGDFKFKRYPCPKFFEEYLSAIESDIKAGVTDPKSLQSVYAEIKKNLEEVSGSYGDDFRENDALYDERLIELDDKIKEIKEQIAATDNAERLDGLEKAKSRLIAARDKLIDGFNKYYGLYESTSRVDISQCEKVKEEIDEYIGAYRSKYENVQTYLESLHSDVFKLYDNYCLNHGALDNLPEGFVSQEEIDEIRNVLATNSGAVYAYTDLGFLKNLVEVKDDTAMSENVLRIMEDMTEALRHALSQVAKSKMPVYHDWNTWTIFKLKYMESSQSRDDIKDVIDVAQKAIDEYSKIDPDDISMTYKPQYKKNIDDMEEIIKSMNRSLKYRGKASGLASQIETYKQKAELVNQQVEDDRLYLSDVYLQFVNIKDRIKYSMTGAMAKTLSGQRNGEKFPVGISGDAIKEKLEDAGIILFSSKRGLGIEELFKEPFIDISTGNSVQSIKMEHLKNVLSSIDDLPVDSYESYQPAYADLKDMEGLEGMLFNLAQYDAEFINFFSFDSGMARAAEDIVTALKEKKDIISAMVTGAGEENALFIVLKNKIDHLVKFGSDQIAMGNFSPVMVLGTQADELEDEYEELGKTDKRVDDSLAELSRLIELAKEKYIDEQNRLNKDIDKGLEVMKDFYMNFKKAYESMDDYQVMNLIDEDWEAGDGTTLTDLEMNLSRTFRAFDEIQYNISNLKISPLPQNTYMVTYDINITSRMFSRNLKHEEKSSVSEEVGIDEKGRVKIIRTLNGRFWQE